MTEGEDKTLLENDETIVEPSAEGGQTQQPEGEEQEQEPKPLSKDEILELFKSESGKIVDEAVRKAQSLSDKAERRVKDLVNAQIDELKDSGIDPSGDQLRALEAKIEKRVRQEVYPESQGGREEPSGDEDEQQDDQSVKMLIGIANAKRQALHEKYGDVILATDPQAKLVDWQEPDVFEFIRQYEAALKDKIAQKTTAQSSDDEVDEEEANARVTRQSASISKQAPEDLSKLSAVDLFKLGYKQHNK